MAAIDPLEVPPFQLQPLLRDINPHVGDLLDLGQSREPPTPTVSSPLDLFARVSSSAIGKSVARPPQPQTQVVVRCAQALGRDVYVGNSDGTLVRYSLQEQGTLRDGNSYQVTGRQTLTSRRPIDQITLIPCIAKWLVFSANTLHFYNLPGIDPIPQALIQSMTRVLAFAVDEQVMRLPSPNHQGPPTVEPVGLCVFIRGQIRVFALRERLLHVKDIPVPSVLSVPRRWGSTICCADTDNYNILGLDQLSFLPVMPLPGMTSPGALPRIIPSGDGGFVVLQASAEGSIAVFLTAGGDPGGALIEMPRFPIDIALDSPHFIALLPNNTIEIHNYTQQPPQLVQIIPRPEDFAPHMLSMSGGSGYLVSAGERDSKLSTTRVQLPLKPPEDKKDIKIDTNTLEGQSGSGLTLPSTPSPPSKYHTSTSYARSRILLTSHNAIQSLVPTTLLSQAESLLGAGREKDVIRLLDIVRKKTGDDDQASTHLKYPLNINHTLSGDPGGALIEMPRFPIDIALDPPHFIALLPNNTIEIHNYTQQPPQLVQIIPRPEGFAPHALSMSGGSGYLVSAGERDSKLSMIRILLSLNPPEDKRVIKIDTTMLEGQSGSDLTPPSTPSPPAKDHTPTSYARSRILLTSNNGIQSLVPTTLLSQAESLLGSGREKDVVRLLDIVRKKTSDEDQDVQVRYIYTQLGYAKLRETHFEEAGNYFFRAEVDARALIRLFPDLCEGLPEYNNPEETMPVFKGLEETVRATKSVEETGKLNINLNGLVLFLPVSFIPGFYLPKTDSKGYILNIVHSTFILHNYSPHLGEGEEPLVTLRDILMGNSRDMLRAFLHKTRNRKRYGGPQARRANEDGNVWKAVDTVLARLFAEAGEITELLDLIKDSTFLTIQTIEPALVKHRQFQALVALCTKLGDEPHLAGVLAKLHDGEYVDANGGVKEPFERVIHILNQTQDAALVRQYGIWVLKHDPALGLKIFTSRTIPKLDDAAVLADMQSVNALAASRFLEHVVLNKRSSDANLHNQLVVRYVDEAIAILEKPGVQPLFSELAQEYVKLPPSPFLLHLAKSDAIPEALDTRIRLALFLQGSNLYNPRVVREKLQVPGANEIFAYENAIISGKMGHHRKALTTLVHEVQDSVSAEVYCALGGVVIPPKVASSVGERRGMQYHAWLVSMGGRRNVPVTEEKRRELLKTLMEVYTLGGTSGREATAIQTAQLLNSQARNFDAVQVLEAIPESWSLSVISSFLERSLRRTMHESREGTILKHISAGQNLAVVDDALQVTKDEGYVVEEADDDDDADSDAVLQQDPLDLDGPSSLVSEGLKRKEGWSEDSIGIS
ncbi:unnamed protein product [Rhizoctonia solani]|uniref:CNH domain-containing protein n=1 Tax=Rhizoctonia solani TaxID=456999 RepID=A0A8H3AFW8_9AGAM|nr:unnamed protein product [Rhizoctonia solani]